MPANPLLVILGPLEGGNHIAAWMGLLFLSSIAQSEASQKKKCNADLMWVLVSVVTVKLGPIKGNPH